MSVDLKVDTEFDLCQELKRTHPDRMVKRYVAAKVISIEDEIIKLKYMNSELKPYQEEIKIKDIIDNIFPLNTFTVKYDILRPFDDYRCSYNPIYHEKRNEIIYLSQEFETMLCVYNISNNSITRSNNYWQYISGGENTTIGWKNDDTLLLMDTSVFIEIDLQTMQRNDIQFGSYNVYGGNKDTSYHCAVTIDDKLHLIAHEMHGIYDENKQQFIGLNKKEELLFAPYWTIYVESMKLLFVFSEESKNIVYCEMNGKSKGEYEWKLYDTLPFKMVTGCSLEFDHIIFLMSNDELEIWCMDVMYHRFFKCSKSYPFSGLNVCCYDKTKQFIHLYDAGYDEGHIQFSLDEIVPNELRQFYKGKYQRLITGYCKKCNLTNLPPSVVVDIMLVFLSAL